MKPLHAVFVLGLPLYYLLVGLAVTLGYHRGLAHHSVRFPRWILRGWVLLALPAGPPLIWARTHRLHHAHVDGPGDPHSPVQNGFWHAHCGWYLGITHPFLCFLYALSGPLRPLLDGALRPFPSCRQDFLQGDECDPFLRFASTRGGFTLLALLHWIPIAAGYGLLGWTGFWGVWGTQAVIYNLGDAVNSVGHSVDGQAPGTRDRSINNPLLALLTLGEGWHKNHHASPRNPCLARSDHQLDIGWLAIRMLSRWGLAAPRQAFRPQGAST